MGVPESRDFPAWRKEKAGWSIHVCAGKGLTQTDVLEMSGLPKAQAADLARLVAKAEGALTAQQRALFDSFEGVLNVEEGEVITFLLRQADQASLAGAIR